MNRKGMFSTITNIVIFFFIMMIAIFAIMYQNVPDFDAKNVTDIMMVNYHNNNYSNMVSHYENSSDVAAPIFAIAYKTIDAVVYSAFQATTFAAMVARQYPDYNWKLIVYVILIAIFAPALYYLFLACVVIFLLIREAVLNRREKKKLNALKEVKQNGL